MDGRFTKESMDIMAQFGGCWLTTEFVAGNMILFGMHTMHALTTNLTDRYRLSCDVCYQPAGDPMDELWKRNSICHSGYQGGERSVAHDGGTVQAAGLVDGWVGLAT